MLLEKWSLVKGSVVETSPGLDLWLCFMSFNIWYMCIQPHPFLHLTIFLEESA